jgi:TP901 family phage tail tape measure protein
LANIHSTITYNANLSPAQAQLKALTGQVAGLTAAFNTLDKSAMKAQASLASTFMANVGQIGGMNAKMVQGNSIVDNFGKAIQNNRLTMRQYFREAINGYTKQNSLMKQLAAQQVAYQQSMVLPMGTAAGGGGRAFVMTPQVMDGMAKSAALASARFSVFNALIDGGATKLLNFGKNTQWAGRQLMVGFTLPLALFTAAASKQFRDLDKELTRFQKVYGQDLGGAIEQSTMKMREQVKTLAFEISSQYGIAATETAALAADIAATGAEGEKLVSSIEQTTKLSVLGEVGRQEAMKTTLALQSAFKMSTTELAESINFLNAVENQTSTTLQDFATAIPKVGPVVKSLGGDIEDLAMMLVAMREGGVPAAEAANAIKSGLASMINPTKKAADVAAEFGINLNKIVTDNKGQLMPTIYAMQDALQGLDDFGRARVIEEIFGKYQFARISALFSNLGAIGSQTESVLQLASSSSAELAEIANSELKVLQESTSMKFQRTLEELKNILIPIGETLTETLIPIFQFIGEGAKRFIDFFQALPEPVKNFAKYGVAIIALAGPVIMLVGLFGNLIANGIKFGMMVVRLGARMAGLRTEKFELLNAEVVAARSGVDGLTGSFNVQDTTLRKLNGAMSAYAASLRTLQTTNPGLFVPMGGRAPIRRAAGSSRPEFVPGSGRGDKIPAMLEPGEFVVNRQATEKYAPVLMAMNRGNLPGFQEGGKLVRSHGTAPKYLSLTDPTTVSTLQRNSSTYAWKMIEADIAKGASTIRVFSNLVLMLTDETNKLLNTTGVNKQVLMNQIKSAESWEFITKRTGLTMQELQPVIQRLSANINNVSGELVDDPMLYQAMEIAVRDLTVQGDKAALALQRLSQQYGTFEVSSGRRENFGAGAYGVPGYKGSGPIAVARTPLQNRDPRVDYSSMFVAGMGRGASHATKSSSPSREADAIGYQTGTNLGRGAVNGLQRGMTAATTAPVSPVGKGLEARGPQQMLANALEREAKASQILEKVKIKETQQLGLIQDTRLRMTSLEQKHNISLANWTKSIDTGLWVHKNGTVAGKKRIEALERLTAEQMLLTQQEDKLSQLVVMRQRAEERATAAAERKATADQRLANTPPPFDRFRDIGRQAGPSSRLTDRPPSNTMAMIAPGQGLRDGMQNRSMNMMNGMFALSMVTSSVSMLGGASNDAAMKLGLFTSALMTATMMMNMGIGKGSFTNFMGLGKVGQALTSKGAASIPAPFAPTRAGAMAARGAGVAGAGNMGLLNAGRALSLLGGPVGIAAGIGVTAAIAGFIMYKKAAEEARERAISAFKDPVKTAEFFGVTLEDTTEKIKDLQTNMEGVSDIDTGLREAVSQDYAVLIEKIRYSGAEAGARELSIAYNKMLASGLSAESAKSAVQAIAAEAGAAGGRSYALALRSNLLKELDDEEIPQEIAKLFSPEQQKVTAEATQKLLTQIEERVGPGGRIQGAIAQNLDNTFGDFMTGWTSFFMNINPVAQIVRAVTDFEVFENIFDKDAAQAAIDQVADVERQIHQMQTNVEEMADVSGESIVEITKIMFENFKDAPKETIEAFRQITAAGRESSAMAFDTQPIKDFINEIDPIGGIILTAMIGDDEEIATTIMEAITAGMDVQEIIKALQEGGLDGLRADVDIAVNVAELRDDVQDIKDEIYSELSGEITLKIEASDADLAKYARNIEKVQRNLEKGEEAMREAFEASEEASDAAVDAMQDEIDVIQDKIDKRREETQEKIDSLNEEKDNINESTDAYLKSIRKRQRADDFYANQRKTSLSALQKLASGDVFGFLQTRQELGQSAQQFAYDNEIERIEDKRDAEVAAIDAVIEAEQKQQEKFEKNNQEKIDLIQDQIDAEKDLQEARRKAFEEQLEEFQETKTKRIEDLKDAEEKEREKRKKYSEIRQAADAQEIVSAKDLTKVLGPELAAPYIEAQKQIIKKMYLAEIAAGEEESAAIEAVRRVYEIFMGLSPGSISSTDPAIQAFLQGIDEDPSDASSNRPGTTTPPSRPPNTTDSGQTPPPGGTSSGQGGSNGNYPWGSPYNNDRTVNNDGDPSTGEGRAMGGFIKGPGTQTSDSIPARLSNGEYVVKASSVSRYGRGMMDAINEQQFAEGGYVAGPDDPQGDKRTSIGKATPKFVAGRNFPQYIKPAPTTPTNTGGATGGTTGGATGTPIFNEGVLSNLGHSLATARNVLQYLDAGGWPRELHRLAWTIAMRESGGNPRLYLDDTNSPRYSPGNGDYGLFQINKRGYGSQPWFDINRLLDGNYNSQMAYDHVSNRGATFMPWAMLKTYNGTSAGFDWGTYGGRPSWGATTERNTHDLWPAFLGYRGGTTTSGGSDSSYTPPPGTSAGLAAVRYAISQDADPYVDTPPGANPPNSWDCSKLTAWSWAVATGADPNKGQNDPNAKVRLTPYSHSQANEISRRVISKGPGSTISGLVPGDILYFAPNGIGVAPGHTSIYAGNGQVFEASSPSAGLRFADLNNQWNRDNFEWGGPPKGYKAGGLVSGMGGPRSDMIPAMLSNGEYVMKASAVSKYGRGMLDQINAGNFGMNNAQQPRFSMPVSPGSTSGISNVGGNSSNVKIYINGADGKSATAIANKVASMINSSNNRRNHSRSL